MKKELFNWGMQCQFSPYIPAGRDRPLKLSAGGFVDASTAPLSTGLRRVLLAEMASKTPMLDAILIDSHARIEIIKKMQLGDVILISQVHKAHTYKYARTFGIRIVTKGDKAMRWE